MALQVQSFRMSTRVGGHFDDFDAWGVFQSKVTSRMLACWREVMKSKVPVDPCTLEPDFSLLMPEAEWRLGPVNVS